MISSSYSDRIELSLRKTMFPGSFKRDSGKEEEKKSCEESKDGSSTNSTDSTDDTQSIPSTSSNRLEY